MASNRKKLPDPVAPEGMEILFFYPCPSCGSHIPQASPTEPRVAVCDKCGQSFPIIPVDEHGLQYLRIMLSGGMAAIDPDFL